VSAPRVYSAIAAITADLARCGIAKSQVNAAEQYAYRGIDEVCNRLAPLLARHRLCILPRVLERASIDQTGSDGAALTGVALRVAYDFVCARDGSAHVVECYGEALDAGDKATSKAMSAAYKQMVLQAFCIPVQGSDDPDATTVKVSAVRTEVPDPAQGWEQWSSDIQEMIRVCESTEALDRVQATYRAELRAASKRRPEVFAAIGTRMQARRSELVPALPKARQHPSQSRPKNGAATTAEVAAHA
jgi:hypothetical protein